MQFQFIIYVGPSSDRKIKEEHKMRLECVGDNVDGLGSCLINLQGC